MRWFKVKELKWEFIDSHYRWGSNASDNLWAAVLPGGEKVYAWGWEADPRDEESNSTYFSLVPPEECWDDNHPQGYDLEDGEIPVFQDLYEVLEYLGYEP